MGGTTIYVTALDNIVTVNSLYAFAVFVGLSWNPIDSQNTTLISDPSCAPPFSLAESVISFQVYSFSSFLFSTLLALSLKQAIRIRIRLISTFHASHAARLNKTALRLGLVGSAVGSASGCVFLMLAIVDLVQFKLGLLSCSTSRYSIAAVVPLLVFVPIALLVYRDLHCWPGRRKIIEKVDSPFFAVSANTFSYTRNKIMKMKSMCVVRIMVAATLFRWIVDKYSLSHVD
ncbi:hypothetical protein Sjap_013429 [Stephania japonica]|uniref:Uncharacterized protein n=1 Tax=Stephania japonica TaxID=461633 RepID=A0AAP0IZV2_9MAGN